jgi:8-oxo-dGTP diphosphatase
MKKYVVGFMFSPDKQFVALIKKNRPEWQAGKLNGIGGKIEDGETPRAAMVREFQEETGVRTYNEDWEIAGRIEGAEFLVFILRAFSDRVMYVGTVTDEKVNLYITDHVSDREIVPNLTVIIPALLLPDITGFFLTY